jgi:hypothetical protein
MSIFGFARTAALIPGVLVFAPGVAAQAAPSDPARFVASIYFDGREATVWAQARRCAARGMVFAQADGAMGAVRWPRSQDRGRTGRVGFRRRDQFAGYGSQELYGQDAVADASHASVVAKLTPGNWVRKSDRENEIRYDLVSERGRWAIDDVHSVIEPNPWSLRALLSQYLAR